MMNARTYRVSLKLTPVDFPAIKGLGQSRIIYQSEPRLNGKMLVLSITKSFILTDDNNKQYDVLSAESLYQVPCTELKSREVVSMFYNDAVAGLNEAYQYARAQMPDLVHMRFPTQPMEHYNAAIDRVLNLIDSQN